MHAASIEQRPETSTLPTDGDDIEVNDTARQNGSESVGEDAMLIGFVSGSWLQRTFTKSRCDRTHVCRGMSSMHAVADGTFDSTGYAIQPEPGRDFYGIPNPNRDSTLKLSDLRERLIRQEETIIFALIERAQFQLNPVIYKPGIFKLPGNARTFSEYLLFEVEAAYAKVRRYTSPDELPFAPIADLPEALLPRLKYPPTLCENDINVNDEIARVYREELLPRVCEKGDDQNYGSSATADVACLQALSKRIHYGKFIAEAKIQETPEVYRRLVKIGDENGIFERLSDGKVEEGLLRRVENKAKSYGSDITVHGPREVYKVKPQLIADIYKKFIIPLTKHVEVKYIMVRCDDDVVNGNGVVE